MISIEALVSTKQRYFSESAKMAMTKVSPSRKLTGNNDSFDDFFGFKLLATKTTREKLKPSTGPIYD